MHLLGTPGGPWLAGPRWARRNQPPAGPPVAFGTLSDAFLTRNVAMPAKNIAADFGGPVSTITLESGTLPAGLGFDGTTLSGTPTEIAATRTLVFRAWGPGGTADTAFDLSVSAVAVNPSITGTSFTAGGGGTPVSITVDVTYAGSDTLTVYAATGVDPVTVSTAQLEAGSGGTGVLEFYDYPYSPPSDSDDITGLTAVSEVADRVVLFVKEDNNGGESAIETVIVSGFDFTNPQVSAAGTTSEILTDVVLSETIVGTEDPADWTLDENTVPLAISGVSISGNTVTLTHATVTGGTTLEVSYAGGDLEDGNGNQLGPITGQPVVNTVSGHSENLVVADGGDYLTATTTLADTPGMFVFASYEQTTAGRRKIAGMGGDMELRSDSGGGDGDFIDPSMRSEDASGGAVGAAAIGSPVALANRVHVLARTYTDGADIVRDIAVWDEASNQAAGSWATATHSGSSSEANLRTSLGALNILHSGGGNPFIGEVARVAVWTFDTAADVPDPTAAAIQNLFTSGGATISPATSQTAAVFAGGDLQADFHGPAAGWNAGTHDGALTFTMTGAVTDA